MVNTPRHDDEELLAELFLDWEEAQATPCPKTPAEICHQRPDLIEALRERIAALNMVDWLSFDNAKYTRSLDDRPKSVVPIVEPQRLPDIFGYEVLEEIGRGGMGIVYKARQLNLGRFVAIKIINGNSWEMPSLLSRLRREAASLGALNHQHVIKVYDVIDRNGFLCLILEFVDGGNLAQKKAGNAMNPREAAEIALTVAKTVSDIHGTGILHRDLKPANLLCDFNGTVKISDFGLARPLSADSSSTMTAEIFGSPSYMAPEQVTGQHEKIGVRTDVYGIGATLYDFLTGRPPFVGASSIETLSQVRQDEPVAPRLLNSQIPRDLETICLKCLEKDPQKRYVDAAALAEDLQNYLSGKPINARRLRPLGVAWKWSKRHPDRALLLASIAVGFALLIGVTSWAVATINGTRTASNLQAELMANRVAAATEKAQVQEFYTGLAAVKERRMQRAPGWSWLNKQAIKKLAVECPVNDLTAKRQLRSEATKSLTAFDARKQMELLNDTDPYTLEFSPDGKLLVVGSNRDQDGSIEATLVDTETWKTQNTLRFEGSKEWMKTKLDGVRSLAFSPDAQELYIGSRSGWIHVFETQNWTRVRKWQAHEHYIHRIRCSTDGQKIYTCSEDATAKSWWKDSREIGVIHGKDPMTDLAILSDKLFPQRAQIVIASNSPAFPRNCH